jgi:hypothetical protein
MAFPATLVHDDLGTERLVGDVVGVRVMAFGTGVILGVGR